MVNGQWSMVNGQWSMVNGQWSMVNGQWSMVNGQWSMVNGQWSMVNGQWSMVNGQSWNSLPVVIAGKADGLEVLFPQGRSEMVANTYRGNELQDEFNKKVAQQVFSVLQRAVGSSEPLPRVLEIGADTCATTRAVIKEMERSNSIAELCISDISLTLVKDAEKQFAAQYPFTSFEVLDIENSDDETITGNGTFDVIYASNVLHATSSIRPVINNIVKLLRPGGVLIIGNNY
ncbi:class I SAM-dependent methyltransferase [Photobacterium rosenbergii]|uniref:Methyltransferase n=1 Tax=Photobacterium rosenbergii TaxID=294936 RepID=A0ABU3ZR43_9GAMM|nr:methyltransferase [Photobacterium rosenbergii]MDV5172423.1 methyltransferase [Photobacterium rosenbergii]